MNIRDTYRFFQYLGNYYFTEIREITKEDIFSVIGSTYQCIDSSNIYNKDNWECFSLHKFRLSHVKYVGETTELLEKLIAMFPLP